ncbi:MAG: T9SS type A sorting domain-containing protein [Bacteroidia bacterium]|nr:T9SS type A sorting domain-containing protein [Bacteroidia bacterium]
MNNSSPNNNLYFPFLLVLISLFVLIGVVVQGQSTKVRAGISTRSVVKSDTHSSGFISGYIRDIVYETPIANMPIQIKRQKSVLHDDGIIYKDPSYNSEDIGMTIHTDENGFYSVELPLKGFPDVFVLWIPEVNGYVGAVASSIYVYPQKTTEYDIYFEKSEYYQDPILESVIAEKLIETREDIQIQREEMQPTPERIRDAYLKKFGHEPPSRNLQSFEDRLWADPIGSAFSVSKIQGACQYNIPANFQIGVGGACITTWSSLVPEPMDDVVAQVCRCEVNIIDDIDGIKAQAISSRTFGYYKNKKLQQSATCGHKYNCNGTPTIKQIKAAQETSGMIMIGDNPAGDDYGDVIYAYYSARCNGNRTLASEEGIVGNPGNCSGGLAPISYLRSVPCSGHSNCNQSNVGETPCCQLQLQQQTHFIYGHGVGLCQRGTEAYSELQNKCWDWIIHHYYTDVCITNYNVMYPDNPASAQAIQVNNDCEEWVCQDLTGATASSPGDPSCDKPINEDIWFSFVAPPSGVVDIDTDVDPGAVVDDFGLMVLESNATTEVICDKNDILGGIDRFDTHAPYMPHVRVPGLSPGNKYYIRMWEFENDAVGPFRICITDPSQPTTGSGGIGNLTWSGTVLSNNAVVNAGSGGSITANLTVINNGANTITGDFYVVWYVSKETTLNHGHTREIARILVNDDLGPGAIKQLSITETDLIGQGLKHGDYYILAKIDNMEDISEYNENDNLFLYTDKIDLPGNGKYADHADYQVHNLSIQNSSQQILANSSIVVKTRIMNKEKGGPPGNGPVSSEVRLYWSLGNSSCGPSDIEIINEKYTVGRLEKNEMSAPVLHTITIPGFYTDEMNLYLCAVADANNAVDEGIDEGNNCRCELLDEASFINQVVSSLKIKVFPVPVSTTTTVEISNMTSNGVLVVTNFMGMVILGPINLPSGTTTYTLNLSNLTDGLYIVRLQSGNEISTSKIKVKH